MHQVIVGRLPPMRPKLPKKRAIPLRDLRRRLGDPSSHATEPQTYFTEHLPVELVYEVCIQSRNGTSNSTVYLQILCHLTPLALLQLSRVNNGLRALILSKNAATTAIWKDALRDMEGLPPCPAWLSEPRYASLCFEMHCDLCQNDVGDDPEAMLWDFGTRYCNMCRRTMYAANSLLINLQLIWIHKVD